MEDLSLHVLDIAENAVRAGGKRICIEVAEDKNSHTLSLSIEDNGKGMDAETLDKVRSPFFTTKKGKEVGLGICLLTQAAEETGGELTILSQEGSGTKVTAVFRTDHPDMKPMGDMYGTVAVLVAGNPETQFVFDYRTDGEHYHFDSFERSGE